jgi:hypothetical protein
MNLVQQFPNMTNQSKWVLKNNKKEKLQAKLDESSNKLLSVFYEKEFKKWHYKLALIIVLILTSLFFFVYTISALLN